MPRLWSGSSELKGFAFVEERLAGIDCLICRTGYTGSNVGRRALRRSGADAAPVEPDSRSGPAAGRRAVRAGGPRQPADRGGSAALWARARRQVQYLAVRGGLRLGGQAGQGVLHRQGGHAARGRDLSAWRSRGSSCRRRGAFGRFARTMPFSSEKGKCVGWVLSAAKVEEKQYALAYIDREAAREGTKVGVYYLARSPEPGRAGQGPGGGERAEAGRRTSPGRWSAVSRNFE